MYPISRAAPKRLTSTIITFYLSDEVGVLEGRLKLGGLPLLGCQIPHHYSVSYCEMGVPVGGIIGGLLAQLNSSKALQGMLPSLGVSIGNSWDRNLGGDYSCPWVPPQF